MSDLFWQTAAQMAKLEPFSPKPDGNRRVDEKRVPSGIILRNRNGLRWLDAPAISDPPKKLCNRWKRWSDAGIFAWMLLELADRGGATETLMIPSRQIATRSPAGQWKRPT